MAIEFPVPFAKMSGTGNDFIVIDHRRPLVPGDEQPDFVSKVCRRMFSVGADGVIFIEASKRLTSAGNSIMVMAQLPRCAVMVPDVPPVLPMLKELPGKRCLLKLWLESLKLKYLMMAKK